MKNFIVLIALALSVSTGFAQIFGNQGNASTWSEQKQLTLSLGNTADSAMRRDFGKVQLSRTASSEGYNSLVEDYNRLQGKFDSRDGELANKDAELKTLRDSYNTLQGRFDSRDGELANTIAELGELRKKLASLQQSAR